MFILKKDKVTSSVISLTMADSIYNSLIVLKLLKLELTSQGLQIIDGGENHDLSFLERDDKQIGSDIQDIIELSSQLEELEELAKDDEQNNEKKIDRRPRSIYRCVHGRHKYRCKDCGTGRCLHGRNKYQCWKCGTDRCLHDKNKRSCKICRKSSRSSKS